MVANEWNELQTLRKTRISVQVVLVIFLMKVPIYPSSSTVLLLPLLHPLHLTLLPKVVGMEHLATADPHSRLWPEEGTYMAESSYVCRCSSTPTASTSTSSSSPSPGLPWGCPCGRGWRRCRPCSGWWCTRGLWRTSSHNSPTSAASPTSRWAPGDTP